jgi:hypothetical protein
LILFGFLSQSSKTKAMAAMCSVAYPRAVGQPDTPGWQGDLDRFRREFYRSCTARVDALFELTDGAPRGAGVPDGGERPPIFPSS